MHIYIFNASQIVSFYCWLVTSISTVGNQNYNVVASTKRNRIPFGKLWEKKSWKKRHKIHRLKTVGGAHHRLLPFPNKANRRNRRRRLFLPSSRCWCPRAGKSYNFFELFVKKNRLTGWNSLIFDHIWLVTKEFFWPQSFSVHCPGHHLTVRERPRKPCHGKWTHHLIREVAHHIRSPKMWTACKMCTLCRLFINPTRSSLRHYWSTESPSLGFR